jgi:hypothetical protein
MPRIASEIRYPIGCRILLEKGYLVSKGSSSSKTPIITREKYSQIENGMSYQQVVGIIGCGGEETAKNNIGFVETVMYQWINSDGSNMNALFQNDGLIQKAQFGLE